MYRRWILSWYCLHHRLRMISLLINIRTSILKITSDEGGVTLRALISFHSSKRLCFHKHAWRKRRTIRYLRTLYSLIKNLYRRKHLVVCDLTTCIIRSSKLYLIFRWSLRWLEITMATYSISYHKTLLPGNTSALLFIRLDGLILNRLFGKVLIFKYFWTMFLFLGKIYLRFR